MATPKTSSNQAETDSDLLSAPDMIVKQLAHLDEGVHAIERQIAGLDFKLAAIVEFIDLHRPALARGLALMDPGAKVRAMLPGRKAKV